MSNDAKRNEYYRNVGSARSNHQRQEMYNDIFTNINNIIFNNRSIFEDMIMQSRANHKKGENIHLSLTLSVKEINEGCSKVVEYEKDIHCYLCKGKGGKYYTCHKCKGRGSNNVNSKTVFGDFFSIKKCTECNGEGYIITDICIECTGYGIYQKLSKKTISIPKGTTKLRVKREGNCIKSGIAGDLILNILIEEGYDIDGLDVLYELYLSIAEACIGCNIQIESAHGELMVTIPPATQYRKVFRLKGKGLHINGIEGNMIITCNIHVPENLSMEEESLMNVILGNDYFKE